MSKVMTHLLSILFLFAHVPQEGLAMGGKKRSAPGPVSTVPGAPTKGGAEAVPSFAPGSESGAAVRNHLSKQLGNSFGFSAVETTKPSESHGYELIRMTALDSKKRPTQSPGKAHYVTLVFGCSRPMNSTTCGDTAVGDLVVKTKFGNGKQSVNLAQRFRSAITFMPSSTPLNQKVLAELNPSLPDDATNGQLKLTVPIQYVASASQKGNTNVSVGNARNSNSSSESNSSPQQSNRNGGNCESSSDCQEGFVCTPTGQCRQGECSWDKKCPKPFKCSGRRCVGCTSDLDCGPRGSGKVCKDNKCEDGGCTSSQSCPPAHMCRSGKCVPTECNYFHNDPPCPEGQVCTTSGDCVPGDCQTSSDCPKGQFCKDNECKPGCRSVFDCPKEPQHWCDKGECKPGCGHNGHCPHCEVCPWKTHQCEKLGECPPHCDDEGVPCKTAKGKTGCCGSDNLCREGKCEDPVCPNGEPQCKGECCKDGQKCGANGCEGSSDPPICEDGTPQCHGECCGEDQKCGSEGCEEKDPECSNGKPMCKGKCCPEGQTCTANGCEDPNTCGDGRPICHGQCCGAGYTCGALGCEAGGMPSDCREGLVYCAATGEVGLSCAPECRVCALCKEVD